MSTEKVLATHAALARIFGEPRVNSTKPQPSPPVFDQAALVEIFSEPLPISTTANSSPPDLDHRALAEMFGKPPEIPVNLQPSPFRRVPHSSSQARSGQLDREEPAAKPVAVAPFTNSNNALPRRAKSLLAEIRSIFSAKAELQLSSVRTAPSPRSLSGQPHSLQLRAEAIASTSPTDARGARPLLAKSPLAKLSPLISTNSELAHLSLKQERLSTSHSVKPSHARPPASELATGPATVTEIAPPLPAISLLREPSSPKPPLPIINSSPTSDAHGMDNVQPRAKPIAITAAAEAKSAPPQQENSLLGNYPLIAATSEPPPAVEREPPRLTSVAWADNAEPEVKPVAVAAPNDPKSVQAQQASSLLVKSLPVASINTQPSVHPSGNEVLSSVLSGQLDHVEPSEKTCLESAPSLQENLSPIEPFALTSTNTKPEPLQPVLSGQQDYPAPVPKLASMARAGSESEVRQPQATLLLSEGSSPGSTNTITPARMVETGSSFMPGQLHHAEPTVKMAATTLDDAETASPKRGISLLAESPLPPSRFFFVAPAAKAAAVASATERSTLPNRAKSLLAKLDLDTAIRLRWLMRDIRGERTPISAASKDDLAALIDMGLVEMREALPKLTLLGDLALD
jgi:hypothetical protein